MVFVVGKSGNFHVVVDFGGLRSMYSDGTLESEVTGSVTSESAFLNLGKEPKRNMQFFMTRLNDQSLVGHIDWLFLNISKRLDCSYFPEVSDELP